MSLSAAIHYGKERRKPYYDSRAFDWSCRAHGGCAYCERSRLRWQRQLRERWDAEMEDWGEVLQEAMDDPTDGRAD